MIPAEAIDRYSRHILVPEIGAAGQERLLASRVYVQGASPSAAIAGDMLDRCGMALTGEAAEATVALSFDAAPLPRTARTVIAWAADDALCAAALTTAPCSACWQTPGRRTSPPTATTAQLLGSLAALTVTTAVLLPNAGSTLTTLDPTAATPFVRTALATDPCHECRERA